MGSPSPLVHVMERHAVGLRTAALARLCPVYSFNTQLWNHLLLSFTTVTFTFISLQRRFLHAFDYPSHTFTFPRNAEGSRWPAQLPTHPLHSNCPFGLLIAHFYSKHHKSSLKGLGWLHTKLFHSLEGLLPNWRNSSYVLREDSPGTITPQLSSNRFGFSSLFLQGFSVSSGLPSLCYSRGLNIVLCRARPFSYFQLIPAHCWPHSSQLSNTRLNNSWKLKSNMQSFF